MMKNTWIWLAAASLTACSLYEEPRPVKKAPVAEAPAAAEAPAVEQGPTPEELAAAAARDAEELAAKEAQSAADRAAEEAADARRKARAKKLFGEVMVPLTEASEAYDEHDELDESSWFGKDQKDNTERIDELLDDAIGVLGISEIATTRSELRRLEDEIVLLEAAILKDREARLGAPLAEELGRIEKTYKKSLEEYDARIADAEAGIATRRAQISDLEIEFVMEMRAIGVDLDLDSARSLLSTVTGDDFVEMCVVFDNVRGVTEQLEELASASGESLDAAKRYYGSYVVLIRLMDRIQKDFVRRTREEMIPKLTVYADRAEEIIQDAKDNMKAGGDPTIGQQNIDSNQLTIQATGLYTQYLREQAGEIEARNEALQVTLRDALNTYDTVALSSQVAAIMKEGRRNFAALLKLELPSLRGFENSELKAEFERLTREMTRIN